MTNKSVIRFEDNAEMRTGLSGWCCRTCGVYWGKSEDGAKFCCATTRQCQTPGCQNLTEYRHALTCRSCQEGDQDARWADLPKIGWDGEMPLSEWDGDKFYFDEEDLLDAIDERLADGGSIDSFRLVLCEPSDPRSFDMEEFQHDIMPPDGGGPDCSEINKIVNDWIEAQAVWSWMPTGKGISPESIREFYGGSDPERAEAIAR